MKRATPSSTYGQTLTTTMFPRSPATWKPIYETPPMSTTSTTMVLTHAEDFFILRSSSEAPEEELSTVVARSAMRDAPERKFAGRRGDSIVRTYKGINDKDERRMNCSEAIEKTQEQRRRWRGTRKVLEKTFLLNRQLNTARVPYPFPRFLREWVGKNVTLFLPDQKEIARNSQ